MGISHSPVSLKFRRWRWTLTPPISSAHRSRHMMFAQLCLVYPASGQGAFAARVRMVPGSAMISSGVSPHTLASLIRRLSLCFSIEGDSPSWTMRLASMHFSRARASERSEGPHFPKVTVSKSEEHTSELQSLMRISYAVFCLKKKKNNKHTHT